MFALAAHSDDNKHVRTYQEEFEVPQWPEHRVPDFKGGAKATAELCWEYWWLVFGERVGPGPIDIRRLIRHLGMRHVGSIRAHSLAGLCIPVHESEPYSFVLSYNPKPIKFFEDAFACVDEEDYATCLRLCQDLILGHELGHTFYFGWKPRTPYTRPTRVGRPNREEELFCDQYAVALVSKKRPSQERAWLRRLGEVLQTNSRNRFSF